MSRLTLDLSKETDDKLTEITKKRGITKAEAMRRAFALLALADDEQKQGNSLGIVKNDNTLVSKVVGI